MSSHTITAVASSKVNLHLGVGNARDDGYHELVTVFQSLSLHDTITVTPATDDSQDAEEQRIVATLSVSGNSAQVVPTDSTNLAWQAAEKMYQAHRRNGGAPTKRVHIVIDKGIPVAGGMAGGSADAAATLAAMAYYLGSTVTEQEILSIAAELGSDVPFTYLGDTRLGTGRGEQLVPVLSRGTYHWALAFSPKGLSTPEVFHKIDQMDRQPRLDVTDLNAALLTGDPHKVAAHLHNDLQAAALSLRPELRTTLEQGRAAGALAGIVSGSGPTCAFLCEDAETAQAVAAELSLHYRTAVAAGPVRGAHVKGH
ncbi:4-(cytidine 5'-diphospho)-2-C-methyl-D-erythritol kinase [Corynebacterium rouxii]|uniref:4-(cytidine 5'-diphospho)-2-C-methyl-D-erythritol kinase n=1 Tax=Corynebacterium rouxii TaxID=2719119 RepID=UPI00313DC6D7